MSGAYISEIKAEYENLKPIFEKLEKLSSSKKKLSMNAEDGIMTAMEEKLMIQAGYLIRDGEKNVFAGNYQACIGLSV